MQSDSGQIAWSLIPFDIRELTEQCKYSKEETRLFLQDIINNQKIVFLSTYKVNTKWYTDCLCK